MHIERMERAAMGPDHPRAFLIACARVAALTFALVAGCGEKVDPIQDGCEPIDASDITYCGALAETFSVCIRCHSSLVTGEARNGAPSEFNFDTYDTAFNDAANANGVIQNGFMPPDGYDKPDQCVRDAFQTWIDLGKPEGDCSGAP
ncbi:MAG: hypothetical protein ABI333_10200 [bacterium]